MPLPVKREDLVVKYTHVPQIPKNPPTGMIAQTLPMAAMFLRNKMLSWVAFSICLQHYLNYRNVPLSEDGNSPLLSLVLAAMGVFTAYMDIFIPSPQTQAKSSSEKIIESATTVVSSVVQTATK